MYRAAYLNTAASDCIAFCISNLILAVGSGPVAFLYVSMSAEEKHRSRSGESVPDLIQELDALNTCLFGNLLVRFAWCKRLRYVVRTGATENDDVEEGICTETVGTVYGHTSGFASSVEARHDLVLPVLVDGKHLASVPRRDTTHYMRGKYSAHGISCRRTDHLLL